MADDSQKPFHRPTATPNSFSAGLADLPRAGAQPAAPGTMNVPGYEHLSRILHDAYQQSATGKGRERHANDKPFDKQPIMEIARMVGVGGHAYQIAKKTQEAVGMANKGRIEAAVAEFRGAIIYSAAAILLLEEMLAQGDI